MRILLAPMAAFLCMAASGEASIPAEKPKDNEALIKELRDRIFEDRLRRALEKGLGIQSSSPFTSPFVRTNGLNSRCTDRLERAEEAEENAQEPKFVTPGPLLRRGPNTPDSEPLAIYAVDRREDGCSVMVIMGDPTDVRPLPSFSANDHRWMPADGED